MLPTSIPLGQLLVLEFSHRVAAWSEVVSCQITLETCYLMILSWKNAAGALYTNSCVTEDPDISLLAYWSRRLKLLSINWARLVANNGYMLIWLGSVLDGSKSQMEWSLLHCKYEISFLTYAGVLWHTNVCHVLHLWLCCVVVLGQEHNLSYCEGCYRCTGPLWPGSCR